MKQEKWSFLNESNLSYLSKYDFQISSFIHVDLYVSGDSSKTVQNYEIDREKNVPCTKSLP